MQRRTCFSILRISGSLTMITFCCKSIACLESTCSDARESCSIWSTHTLLQTMKTQSDIKTNTFSSSLAFSDIGSSMVCATGCWTSQADKEWWPSQQILTLLQQSGVLSRQALVSTSKCAVGAHLNVACEQLRPVRGCGGIIAKGKTGDRPIVLQPRKTIPSFIVPLRVDVTNFNAFIQAASLSHYQQRLGI
jgi:hypothetical protein